MVVFSSETTVHQWSGRPGFNTKSSFQKLKKWYLMPPRLTLSIIRYGSKVKWRNLGKGVAPPRHLMKREPSAHPRLQSPTLLFFFYIRRVKAWTDKLPIILKSDHCDKIKLDFFKQWLFQHYCMDAPFGR